jgi:hypothetical protein
VTLKILLTFGLAALMAPCPDRDQVGTYAEELAAAKRAGLPLNAADLKRPHISESENAASLYRRLDAIQKARPERYADVDEIMAVLRPTPPIAKQIARSRHLLAARKTELTLIHEAVSRRRCDFRRDWSLGPNLMFPELSRMRSAVRLLAGESGLMLRDGRPVDAVRNMALGFRIAEHANNDGFLIGHLVAIAIDAITFRGLETILYSAGSLPGVAEAVTASIDKLWKPRSLADGLKSEIVMQRSAMNLVRGQGLSALRQLTSGDEPDLDKNHKPKPVSESEKRLVGQTLESSGAYLLHITRVLTAVADSPYPQAQPIFERISVEVDAIKDPHLMLVAVLSPALDQMPANRSRGIAKAQVIRASASVLKWKQSHGSFPDNLGQAFPSPPTDPFNLRPLNYAKTGSGFVVYSVGATGHFDGNPRDKRQRNVESVFRYPDTLR